MEKKSILRSKVDFLEEISDEKLCLSLEEVESEQKVNDSVRFATLNDYELHEIVKKFVRSRNTRWCVNMFE